MKVPALGLLSSNLRCASNVMAVYAYDSGTSSDPATGYSTPCKRKKSVFQNLEKIGPAPSL
jgi:hypothetical protein